MPLVMYHKTNNNNMTRQTEDEIEYGHFYDVEKDEYLDKYKHLKKIIIKRKKIQPPPNDTTNKKGYFCDMITLTSYVLVSTITVSFTIYYFS
jgi:hypothetical protein